MKAALLPIAFALTAGAVFLLRAWRLRRQLPLAMAPRGCRLIHLLHGFGDLLTQPLMRGIAVRTLVPEHGHLVTWHFQRRLDHL